MILLYFNDLIPIILSSSVFIFLSMIHKTMVPEKYSSILQFRAEENLKKTINSSLIRVIYIILGTCFLYIMCSYSEKQIEMGVFLVTFLNIWPAVIQNHLLKIKNNKTEWSLLLHYLLFVIMSVLISALTIHIFIPVLKREMIITFLNNKAIDFLITLILVVFPISMEIIIDKYFRIVITQTVDSYKEELYILENQINMENYYINKNKYIIDSVSEKYNINSELLTTILKLEIFYRKRLFHPFFEKLICKYFSSYAIKKDITVGIAQMKISTVEKVLKKDPKVFIRKICYDPENIEACAKYLKYLIDLYYHETDIMYSIYNYRSNDDIFDYISDNYLGTDFIKINRTVLLYSAILRSILKDKSIFYSGMKATRCLIHANKIYATLDDYNSLIEKINELKYFLYIKEKIFIENQIIVIKAISYEKNSINNLRVYFEKNGFECSVSKE